MGGGIYVTEVCPNCKTANPDNSGFCQECGTELKGKTNVVKSNATTGNGLTDYWNKQNNGGKAAIVISVCCVGLILLVAIGAMVTSDKTIVNLPCRACSKNGIVHSANSLSSTPPQTDVST